MLQQPAWDVGDSLSLVESLHDSILVKVGLDDRLLEDLIWYDLPRELEALSSEERKREFLLNLV